MRTHLIIRLLRTPCCVCVCVSLSFSESPNNLAQWFYISEVLDSNLGHETVYPTDGFRGFPQFLQADAGIVPRLNPQLLPRKEWGNNVATWIWYSAIYKIQGDLDICEAPPLRKILSPSSYVLLDIMHVLSRKFLMTSQQVRFFRWQLIASSIQLRYWKRRWIKFLKCFTNSHEMCHERCAIQSHPNVELFDFQQ
jgi:hypothetical protein